MPDEMFGWCGKSYLRSQLQKTHVCVYDYKLWKKTPLAEQILLHYSTLARATMEKQ